MDWAASRSVTPQRCCVAGQSERRPQRCPGYWATPSRPPAALCALYQLDRQYERALPRCTEALCDGEDAEVYSNRGSAHLMIDEIDRAISDFDRAIQLEPDIAIRYYNRGIAFSRKHQAHKAIDDYPRAIRLRHDLAPAYSKSRTRIRACRRA